MTAKQKKPELPKVLDDQFWNILATLDSLNQDVSLQELSHHFGNKIKDDQILDAVNFLRKFNFPLKAKKKNGNIWLCFEGKKPKVSMELSLTQWIALQAHFPLLSEYEGKEINSTLLMQLGRVEGRHPDFDLFKVLKNEENIRNYAGPVGVQREHSLDQVNRAIYNNSLLSIKTKTKTQIEIFPHKIVFLDNELSLIGEDTNDRCLLCISYDSIVSVMVNDEHDYKTNFANQEIEDFIMALRSINGNEERLVLRISSPEKVNLKPDYHFLGNPYVTTNTDGEFIWAASVEVTEELFKWMASIKDDIIILDPQDIKDDFQKYLLELKVKEPFKKAS